VKLKGDLMVNNPQSFYSQESYWNKRRRKEREARERNKK
jgi:hypothetical protein